MVSRISSLLFTCIVAGISWTSAKTVYVGGSSKLHTIAEGLQSAANGDQVIIASGVYRERNLVVTKRLTIRGINRPVIDAQLLGQVFLVQHDSVAISGLSLQNTGMSAMEDYAGIRVQEANYVIIKDNVFSHCCYGVFIASSNYCSVIANHFAGSPAQQQLAGNGIHGWHSTNLTIANNTIEQQRDGIYFEFVFFSTIENNHSFNNLRYGLHFMFSDNNRFVSNAFDLNGAGVAIMYSKHVTMLNNEYAFNVGGSAYGLLLKDIQESYILFNRFKKNTCAIYMEGVSRSVVLHNDFTENGWGIRVQSSCDNNTLSFNNFVGNTFDISTNGTLVLNSFNGNYWDHYEGYDLDHHGIGDVVFRPVSVFSMMSENIPESMIMLHSFSVSLIDRIEKVVPEIIPEKLMDAFPFMNKINNGYPG